MTHDYFVPVRRGDMERSVAIGILRRGIDIKFQQLLTPRGVVLLGLRPQLCEKMQRGKGNGGAAANQQCELREKTETSGTSLYSRSHDTRCGYVMQTYIFKSWCTQDILKS